MRTTLAVLLFLVIFTFSRAIDLETICDTSEEVESLIEDLAAVVTPDVVNNFPQFNPYTNDREGYYLYSIDWLTDLDTSFHYTISNTEGTIIADTNYIAHDRVGNVHYAKSQKLLSKLEPISTRPEILRATFCGDSGWAVRPGDDTSVTTLYYAKRVTLENGEVLYFRVRAPLNDDCDLYDF
eukprot:TRINITY_DN419_c0_g1_i1.p1 TRINITY_DN419_c0_g1~~TRINITY_DN419_c0_g1_i1.p1  ORF type:complete len:207 (-),score=36.75 TRINITY_DN419_c0_g1_i1:180-725(-)